MICVCTQEYYYELIVGWFRDNGKIFINQQLTNETIYVLRAKFVKYLRNMVQDGFIYFGNLSLEELAEDHITVQNNVINVDAVTLASIMANPYG